MSRPETRKRIHSFAEVYLSLMVSPCPHCGQGPIGADRTNLRFNADEGIFTVALTCQPCGARWDACFDIRRTPPEAFSPLLTADLPLRQRRGELATLNTSDEPSELIDVPGWVALHNLLLDCARQTAENGYRGAPAGEARAEATVGARVLARQMQIQAGECLDEALKFFEEDNQLPPQDAFFTEAALRQFRHCPELFTRDRLIEMRNRLPLQRT